MDPNGYAPLGHVTPHFSHAIVDRATGTAVPGGTGELYLGGPCVGLGYYNQPEQTAEAFVQNPTHDRFADRMYRTGDIVREDPADGLLHFVGRADRQIKHQGYRIELAEIEHALHAIAGVDQAAVVYVTIEGRGRIVGVVSLNAPLATAAIREALLAALPRYMIPERIVLAEQLPKNANGKIDRSEIEVALMAGRW
jgi:D-alanine--poly(phosphoribitol) ligase subunit 1